MNLDILGKAAEDDLKNRVRMKLNNVEKIERLDMVPCLNHSDLVNFDKKPSALPRDVFDP